jgi:hypothetical protein
MDQNTTNINELPIDQNPPENRDLPEQTINSMNRRIIDEPEPERRVHFKEPPKPTKTTLYDVSETNKVIILATIFFLLFSDGKVRNYIIEILLVIFGNSLKTQSGGISKIGLVFYSTVYGLSLFLLIFFVDILINKFG